MSNLKSVIQTMDRSEAARWSEDGSLEVSWIDASFPFRVHAWFQVAQPRAADTEERLTNRGCRIRKEQVQASMYNEQCMKGIVVMRLTWSSQLEDCWMPESYGNCRYGKESASHTRRLRGW